MPNAKEVYKNIRIRYIDLQKCICYNCHRQKEVIKVQCKAKALRAATLGAFFLCFYGALTGASCCCYRLSNHLQMRWQVTPAATAIKKEVIGFNEGTPFLLPDWGSNVITISWIRTNWNIQD